MLIYTHDKGVNSISVDAFFGDFHSVMRMYGNGGKQMSAKIDFLYLSEPDMIKAGVKDMGKCVEVMEDMMVTLKKGDYVMGGENHNSHGCMVTFPDNPEFEGMPKNGEDRRFMAMPAYLGGNFQMAGMKW